MPSRPAGYPPKLSGLVPGVRKKPRSMMETHTPKGVMSRLKWEQREVSGFLPLQGGDVQGHGWGAKMGKLSQTRHRGPDSKGYPYCPKMRGK